MYNHGWIVDVLIDIAKFCDKNNLPLLHAEICAILSSLLPSEQQGDQKRHELVFAECGNVVQLSDYSSRTA